MIKLALPLMATFLAQKGMQVVDTVMMGWIGPYALAAGALGAGIFMTIIVFCMGVLSAVGVSIARTKGAREFEDIKVLLQNGLWLAGLLSIPCMALIWLIPHVLLLYHMDPVIIQNTQLFLQGLVWGFPGFLFFLVFREFVSAFSLARMVMLVTVSSIPLTFVANYILIYGKFGFPALGVEGIGFAGAIVMWTMFFAIFFYSLRHAELKSFIDWQKNLFSFKKIRSLFQLGSPSGTMIVLDVGTFLSAACMISYMSVNTLAAHQIALQCTSILFAVPFSLSMATALRVSHALGEKNMDDVYRAIKYGIGLGVMVSGLIGVVLFTIPETIVKLFVGPHIQDYAHVVHIAAGFLSIAAFFQILDAVQAIATGALRGLKDTFIPMLLCVIYFIVGAGSAYILGFHTSLGANGVWYGLTLGISTAGILLGIRLIYILCVKLADKPGSVVNSHYSGASVATDLKRPTRI